MKKTFYTWLVFLVLLVALLAMGIIGRIPPEQMYAETPLLLLLIPVLLYGLNISTILLIYLGVLRKRGTGWAIFTTLAVIVFSGSLLSAFSDQIDTFLKSIGLYF